LQRDICKISESDKIVAVQPEKEIAGTQTKLYTNFHLKDGFG